MSIFSSYKKIFLLGFIIVILIAIPFSIYIAQQRQNISSKAAASTSLSFEPTSITAHVDDIVTLGIILDPGAGTPANQISFVKLSIKFDPTKFTTVTDSLTPNPVGNALKEPIDTAQYDNIAGKATLSLSIGADPINAIKTRTKIAILKLKATAVTTPVNPNITFSSDPADTQALSIASSDQTSENVLSPSGIGSATITVTSAVSSATSSTGKNPVCSNLNIDRSATGTAPYSLTFTASGTDADGTIQKATFDFGDGTIQDISQGGNLGTNSISVQISHTYRNTGTFQAKATLTDNSGGVSSPTTCTQTVTLNAGGGIGGSGTLGSLGNSGAGNTGVSSQGGQLLITETPQVSPTLIVNLPPTGSSNKIIGLGTLGIIFTIIGGALFIFL